MSVQAVQNIIYRKITQSPRANRLLDGFGNTLNRIGISYATGLTRNKAILFATRDAAERIAARENLQKLNHPRADWAVCDYENGGRALSQRIGYFLFDVKVSDPASFALGVVGGGGLRSSKRKADTHKILALFSRMCMEAVFLKELSLSLAKEAVEKKDQSLLERALAVAEGIEEIKGEAECYYKCQAITGIAPHFAALGDNDGARALLERVLILSEEIDEPNYFNRHTTAKAEVLAGTAPHFATLGDKERALALLEQALTLAKRVETRCRDQAIAEVAPFFAAAGFLERALDVAGRIESSDYKSKAMAKVVPYLAALGQWERALTIAEKGIGVSRHDYRHYKPLAIMGIMSHFAAVRDKEQAKGLLEKVLAIAEGIEDWDGKGKPRAIAKIASHFAALGDKERALALLEQALTQYFLIQECPRNQVRGRCH